MNIKKKVLLSFTFYSYGKSDFFSHDKNITQCETAKNNLKNEKSIRINNTTAGRDQTIERTLLLVNISRIILNVTTATLWLYVSVFGKSTVVEAMKNQNNVFIEEHCSYIGDFIYLAVSIFYMHLIGAILSLLEYFQESSFCLNNYVHYPFCILPIFCSIILIYKTTAIKDNGNRQVVSENILFKLYIEIFLGTVNLCMLLWERKRKSASLMENKEENEKYTIEQNLYI